MSFLKQFPVHYSMPQIYFPFSTFLTTGTSLLLSRKNNDFWPLSCFIWLSHDHTLSSQQKTEKRQQVKKSLQAFKKCHQMANVFWLQKSTCFVKKKKHKNIWLISSVLFLQLILIWYLHFLQKTTQNTECYTWIKKNRTCITAFFEWYSTTFWFRSSSVLNNILGQTGISVDLLQQEGFEKNKDKARMLRLLCGLLY